MEDWKAQRDVLQDVIVRAKAVLFEAEINPRNYDHDEVVELNDAAVQAWKILDSVTVLP